MLALPADSILLPQDGRPLRSDGLGAKIQFAYNAAHGNVDLVTRLQGSASPPFTEPAWAGKGTVIPSATNAFAVARVPDPFPLTVMCVARCLGWNGANISLLQHIASNNGWQFRVTNNHQLQFVIGSPYSTYTAPTSMYDRRNDRGSVSVVGVRIDAGFASFFVNGERVATIAVGSYTLNSTAASYALHAGDVHSQSYLAAAVQWSAALSDDDIQMFSAAPGLVFEPDYVQVYFPAASSAGNDTSLAGNAAAQSSATGVLTTAIPVVGAAVSVASATGALSTGVPLTGAAASVASANGNLTASIRFNGSALAQANASGGLTASIRLSGTALATALATGALSTSTGGLEGAAQATATATGALTTAIRLIGGAQATAGGAAGLSTSIPLSGAAVSVSTATGDINIALTFSGAAAAQAAALGQLTTQITFSGAAIAQALANATFTGTILRPRVSVGGQGRRWSTKGGRRDYSESMRRRFVA